MSAFCRRDAQANQACLLVYDADALLWFADQGLDELACKRHGYGIATMLPAPSAAAKTEMSGKVWLRAACER
jgi:hypothetical protein